MKPQIALKLDYSPLNEYTRIQVETVRDEWIRAYREISGKDTSREKTCAYLIDRIERAAELFIRRYVEPTVSDAISHDDYYYEWLEEIKKDQDDTLDGDFPLGNGEDMEFASPYFTVRELALIQAGCADEVYAGYYVEYADRVLVRMGILAEARGDYHEAASAYSGVCYSKTIQEREHACRRKAKENE